MSAAGEQALACREGAGLFSLRDRGLVVVEGADRVRWLNGMLSNDVAALRPGRERSGCYALLLTRIGRIVADVHVLLREGAFWLETDRAAVAPRAPRASRRGWPRMQQTISRSRGSRCWRPPGA
jgi:folate-binding Fe-S cluster repair protein YgfZ